MLSKPAQAINWGLPDKYMTFFSSILEMSKVLFGCLEKAYTCKMITPVNYCAQETHAIIIHL